MTLPFPAALSQLGIITSGLLISNHESLYNEDKMADLSYFFDYAAAYISPASNSEDPREIQAWTWRAKLRALAYYPEIAEGRSTHTSYPAPPQADFTRYLGFERTGNGGHKKIYVGLEATDCSGPRAGTLP